MVNDPNIPFIKEDFNDACHRGTAKPKTENTLMITALIAHPKPDEINRPRHTQSSPTTADTSESHRETLGLIIQTPTKSFIKPSKLGEPDDDRQITILISLMFVTLVLPAFLMIAYLILYPDAFTYDIAPKYHFSDWRLGQPLRPID